MSTHLVIYAVVLIILVLIPFSAKTGIVNARSPTGQASALDPTLVLIPDIASPGSSVQVSGMGFTNGNSTCSISSPSPDLFQPKSTPKCFGGVAGNITGIFQVNTFAAEGVYTVFVNDSIIIIPSFYSYTPFYTKIEQASADLAVAVQLVTKTVSTTVSTTRLVMTTKTSISTTNKTEEIRTELTLPQAILTASATAAVTAVAARIYVSHRGATVRISQKAGTKPRPGFAFDVEVRSGVDREESSD